MWLGDAVVRRKILGEKGSGEPSVKCPFRATSEACSIPMLADSLKDKILTGLVFCSPWFRS